MSTSEDRNQFTQAQSAYEKAIEGYQFQVGRYNIWMNYYAISVGALFVALYSIWPNATDGSCRCCNCSEPTPSLDAWFLPFVISALGFFASICWYGALLGYRKWNGHWMETVQNREKNLNESQRYPVYNTMPGKNGKYCFLKRIWRDIKRRFDCKNSTNYAAGYVSTQKITGVFIVFIMLAWIAAFAFAMYQCCGDCRRASVWAGIGVVIMIALLCCLHYGRCCLFSSEIV